MNSFYLCAKGSVGEEALLLPEEARHAFQVLRLRPGETVFAVDAQGQRFSAVIEAIDREKCAVRLVEELPSNEAPLRLTLYQGLPKGDKLDWIVQKITELGASALVPVKMERCVVKWEQRDALKRQERLERIAREAAKQCKRACALEVEPLQNLHQLSEKFKRHELVLVPWEDASGTGMAQIHEAQPAIRDIGIVIGPEGGMSAGEAAALEKMGARTIRLGPRILRTETAALAACTMAMLLWGDMG